MNEPPVTNRPPDFSQIVGQYSIRAKASPTEVFVEDPIKLEISITGQGPKQYQPQYRNLHECLFPKEAEEQFFIEPIPGQDNVEPVENTWNFVFRLRPKTANVQTLPLVRLSYYAPELGQYQTDYAEPPISIVVKPKQTLQRTDVKLAPLEAPERFYRLVKGEAVLDRESVRPYWTMPVLLAVSLGPPLLSVILFLCWRRLYPDASRQLQRRRSRASSRAVKELSRAKRALSPEGLVAILTGYLNQRLDFPAAEGTPAEIAHWLRRRGVSSGVHRRWVELFRVCDTVRFGPKQNAEKELRPLYVSAAALISDLEGDPCLAKRR